MSYPSTVPLLRRSGRVCPVSRLGEHVAPSCRLRRLAGCITMAIDGVTRVASGSASAGEVQSTDSQIGLLWRGLSERAGRAAAGAVVGARAEVSAASDRDSVRSARSASADSATAARAPPQIATAAGRTSFVVVRYLFVGANSATTLRNEELSTNSLQSGKRASIIRPNLIAAGRSSLSARRLPWDQLPGRHDLNSPPTRVAAKPFPGWKAATSTVCGTPP